MADGADRLQEGFAEAVRELAHLADQFPKEVDAFDVGWEAGRAALAPLAWAQAVGERIQAESLVAMLGITSQELEKQVRNQTLIGLPGRRTTHFPIWQFNHSFTRVQPAAIRILRVFRTSGEFDPYMIAAWMNAECPDLDGVQPSRLLDDETGADAVVEVAKIVARKWAQ